MPKGPRAIQMEPPFRQEGLDARAHFEVQVQTGHEVRELLHKVAMLDLPPFAVRSLESIEARFLTPEVLYEIHSKDSQKLPV